MELEDLMSLNDAAKELGVAAVTLRAQASRGRLRAVNVGGSWITTRQDVDRYRAAHLDRRGRPPSPILVARIPWHDSMYASSGTTDLQVLKWPDAAAPDVLLVEDLAQEAIAKGAYTLAEVIMNFHNHPDARDLPIQFGDAPPLVAVAPRPSQFAQQRPSEPALTQDLVTFKQEIRKPTRAPGD